MNFDAMLDAVYDDEALVEWVENASRDALALRYMELMARYRGKCREIKNLQDHAVNMSWERTMRQQERSGGTM
jgi:hypothetical protein